MFLKELLFPKFCLGCGFIGVYICSNCQKKLKRINKDQCLYCGKASFNGRTHPGCVRSRGIDGFISLFYYDNLLKKIIKNIKYRGVYGALKELLTLIDYETINKIKKTPIKNPMLQSIPLHPKREKERGFNQVDLIVELLGRTIGWPIGDFITRQKPTAPQAQINKKQDRQKNMSGAFSTKKPIMRHDFLLVDDVLTSGSTIKEAAKTLKNAGAEKIYVFTLAKG